MRTIGQVLKQARKKKKYSRDKLESKTKIKKSFIESLENEQWSKLPEYTVVVGFVKSIAGVLGVDNKVAVALLRRDYPQKLMQEVHPGPEIEKKITWSPRLTFFVGVGIILVFTLGYLLFQYVDFVAEPKLEVYSPKEGEVIKQREIKVSGKTDDDASIVVNNQPVLTNDEGVFIAEVEIFEGTSQINVEAISRSGRKTNLLINIKPEISQ